MLLDDFSVRDNILLPLKFFKLSKKALEERRELWISRLGLGEILSVKAKKLSPDKIARLRKILEEAESAKKGEGQSKGQDRQKH